MGKVIFLYSNAVENQLSREQFAALWDGECGAVCAETLRPENLEGAKAVVYAPGRWVCDETFAALCHFYKQGGTLILLGAKALSQPYAVREGKLVPFCESVDYIRSLGPVEQYIQTFAPESCTVRVQGEEYAALRAFITAEDAAQWREISSAQYNLARTERSAEGEFIPDARQESIVELLDENGRVQAVPVSVVTHFTEGTIVLASFTPKDAAYYSGKNGAALLRNLVRRALLPKVFVRMETEYARVNPGETAAIESEIRLLHGENVPFTAEIELTKRGDADFNIKKVCQGGRTVFENLPEGQYDAALRVRLADGTLLAERTTGFFVMTQQEAVRRASAYPRITVNPQTNSEYCLQNGKPFTMHGTTFFVTDAYRGCYLHFNAARCGEELAAIARDGFNILRTGNWRENLAFYGPDGECSEKAMRALEIFFMLAAENNLTVQFVLGSFMFNNWDRTKDPLHNPEIRQKVMRVMRTFCTRFADFPNVMMDIINEPSYSFRGGWTLGRPSLDEYEKKHWIEWLREKYRGDLSALHDAWRCTGVQVPSFEEAPLPEDSAFDRFIARTEKDIRYAPVTDFYQFARDSYSDWVREIRSIARETAPEMVVMMGRDESIRIPSEQDEIARGNIDFSNWHQWITNSIVFMEYYLNKVRGVPCCGQELGVYQQENGRGFKSLSDKWRARVLEKKLLYSFGNWLQWQVHSDPYLSAICETTLGLYRADGTETPSMRMTHALNAAEESFAPYLKGFKGFDLLTLHPTYDYFSMCNPLAIQGVRSHALTLNYRVKAQDDLVLEHLFTEENRTAWGDPKAIFVPCAQMMSDAAWQLLLKLMREEGKTVVLCGTPDRDEYFRPKRRLEEIFTGAKSEPIYGNERICLNGREFFLDFRRATAYAEPGHAIEKAVLPGDEENAVRVASVGKGKLVFCPLPVQLAESADAVEALYRFALDKAGWRNERFVCTENKSHILIYPMAFEDATVYTLVNEGARDSVRFVDLASGKSVETELLAQCGCKLCLTHDGRLAAHWSHEPVKVGTEVYPASVKE